MSREAMSFGRVHSDASRPNRTATQCCLSTRETLSASHVYFDETKSEVQWSTRPTFRNYTHSFRKWYAFVAFGFFFFFVQFRTDGRTTTGADRKAINFTEKIDTKQNKRNEWQQPNNNRQKKKRKKRGEHSILWDFWNRKIYLRDLYSSLIGRRISIDRFWSIDWILAARTLAQHTHTHHSKWRRSTIRVDDKNFLLGST